MSSRPLHRGQPDATSQFAVQFIAARLVGFQKDISICLTGVPSPTGAGVTYAYFPALATCCATLEYLTSMHSGRIDGIGWQQVAAFSEQYMIQPDYERSTVRVLFGALRNSVAHRGIASGIWIDRAPGANKQRRMVWYVSVGTKRPACSVVPEDGQLSLDPPWPARYTHRIHVHLRRLSADIVNAANAYAADLDNNPKLMDNFRACMRQLYPA